VTTSRPDAVDVKTSQAVHQNGIVGADPLRKAIAHPLRVKILECLLDGPHSPTTLGRAIGSSVRDVCYHVDVLEDDCEVLEPVHDDDQRADSQRFVRLRRDGATLSFRPSLFDSDGWTRANQVLRSADQAIEIIEAESRERLKAAEGGDTVHAVLGLALFGAAPPSSKLASESTGGG
jgi:DNA-binding transcriptional ArsR family regulator